MPAPGAAPAGHRGERGPVGRGPLEVSERRAGFDTEFGDERAASVGVGGERVGLAAGAVQREDLLPAQPFAQRMRGDERIELGEHVDVPAAGKVGLDPVLQRRQPAFLEALHMLADSRLVRRSTSAGPRHRSSASRNRAAARSASPAARHARPRGTSLSNRATSSSSSATRST